MSEQSMTLIPVMDIKKHRPDWPFSVWWTGALIRRKDLGCIRIGRRLFVTNEIIESFYRQNASPSI